MSLLDYEEQARNLFDMAGEKLRILDPKGRLSNPLPLKEYEFWHDIHSVSAKLLRLIEDEKYRRDYKKHHITPLRYFWWNLFGRNWSYSQRFPWPWWWRNV